MRELIAFFSRKDENYLNGSLQNLKVGHTEFVARIIQELTQGELFQIEMTEEYSKNYNECITQAHTDQKKNARPELKAYPENIDSYDVIYLGYPNYWSTMPMAMFTFLEQFRFTGKTILPFCTHEGSGLGNSIKDIIKLCPNANVKTGLAIRGGKASNSKEVIEKWLEQNR